MLRFCQMVRRDSVQKRSVHGVREYFEADRNTAIGQKMGILSQVLPAGFFLEGSQRQNQASF